MPYFQEMSWQDVNNWTMYGGSFLGTQKSLPTKNLEKVAEQFRKFNIHGLLMIGGFEAYHSCLIMANERTRFKEFCIPMVAIPCTISNNVPGSDYSIGSDTGLDEICTLIDNVKQSAIGTKRRVFIVETMGGYCGYLATLSALGSGADNAYIFEEPFSVDDIKEDVHVIAQKMRKGVQRYIIMRNENANQNYTTQFLMQLFSEEGKGAFTTRINVLGHAQQGGSPSPFDRNMATRMAAHAVENIVDICRQCRREDGSVYTMDRESACLLGMVDRHSKFTSVFDLSEKTDFEHRMPKQSWWLKLRPLLRILAKHDSIYETEAVKIDLK
ncbi:unnamed protein product [Soboliphyme baturini]|uniref:6-phosphofructokinase n=1 Tax=Soboliphyme baturini TaxID=241478 RepID=A0A183I9M1_9BILA|nr:unnamed protein product [Soboliphyme baturini]